MVGRNACWNNSIVVALLIASTGCQYDASPYDDRIQFTPEATGERGLTTKIHDFGGVLAQGQTLHHEFTLENSSQNPLRIIEAKALAACCSSIGEFPRVIPPKQAIKIPVSFHVGNQSGKHSAPFLLRTAGENNSSYAFSVQAELVPEFEAKLMEGSDQTINAGETGSQAIEITCRRSPKSGLSAPVSFTATPAIMANFRGPPRTRIMSHGLIESTFALDIVLPEGQDAGPRQAEVVLRWQDGTERVVPIRWYVELPIHASPKGLVLNAGEGTLTRRIRIHSAQGPFRVLGVSGQILAKAVDLDRSGRAEHLLAIELNPDRVQSGQATDIVVETDDLRQPRIFISAIVLGESELKQ